MKKCAFSLLLVLVMVFGLLPMTAQADELDNGLKYSVFEDQVVINGYTGEATEIVIPAEIEGFPVTCIGYKAFWNCDRLTSIDLPDSLTSIDEYAFEYCSNLTSIDLPDSLASIDYGAFGDCTSLTSIDLPDSLTFISNHTFDGCTSLTEIHVDENNLYYSSDDGGVLFNKDKTELIQAPGGIAGSYTIPDGVTSIGDKAFYSCNSMTTVSIPDSLTELGSEVFLRCSSLIEIHVDDNNRYYSNDDGGVLFNKDKTKLIQAPGGIAGSYTIPSTVTYIYPSAFNDCDNLTDIDIPNSVTGIYLEAFAYCDGLTSILIPDSVTFIGDYAFGACDNLASIYFKGDAPDTDLWWWPMFEDVTATAYYPEGNPTWTADAMQDCGGDITWIPYTPSPFNDAAIGSFYYDPVLWAVENGITTGATATSFNPNGTCLRAQVVTFLHRADGNPEPTSSKNPFTDVKSGDFFYKPVLWAVEKGITNGVDATHFGPAADCNRAAVVTFLWRAAGSPEPESTNNPFVDVKTTDFFYKPVLWAVENGITNGVDATHFGPAADCNRAQVVTFLYRAFSEQ